jgi:hypothetical protein
VAELPTEDQLAEMAYAAWRKDTAEPGIPAWGSAAELTRQAWVNRVGSYLEFRWSAMEDHGQMDRHVREVCDRCAFPD